MAQLEPPLARLRPTSTRTRLDLLITPAPGGGTVVIDLTVVAGVFALLARLREAAPGAVAADAAARKYDKYLE